MIRGVIFDVDGVLVDSVNFEIESWLRALREFGFAIERPAIACQMGKGADNLLPALLDEAQRRRWGDGLAKRQGKIFDADYRGKVCLFPGVRPLFEHLRREHRAIALASSGKADGVRYYERLAGIENLVDARVCMDDVEHSKPCPDLLHAALKELDLPPDETVDIGDSLYDVEAASAAGIRTIGLESGCFSADDLSRAGCVAVYRNIAALFAEVRNRPIDAIVTGPARQRRSAGHG